MKHILFIISLIGILGCTQKNKDYTILKNKVDSLESKLADAYKPGFGELMTSIQTHHAKLWFAGINRNWKLADFEIHEINEVLENIKIYRSERKETKSIDMLIPAIDSVKTAIENKNSEGFDQSYTYLTDACNRCHKLTDFEFIKVKIPEKPFFTNQDFEVK